MTIERKDWTAWPHACAWFWMNVDAEGDCWLWTKGRTGAGYGHFQADRRDYLVHRFAYELLVGPIPDGMQIDHLCRVRHCVNPDHMEVVDARTNTLRGHGPSARAARSAMCEKGHPFEWRGRRGGRVVRWCRVCANELQRRYRAARVAA